MKNVRSNQTSFINKNYTEPWEQVYLQKKEAEKIKIHHHSDTYFQEKFTKNELLFLAEIHKGTSFNNNIVYRPELLSLKVTEAENIEELKARFKVDVDIIVSIITFLTYEETKDLVKWACRKSKTIN